MNDFTPPCGACRQVIYELAGNIDVVLAKKNGEIKEVKMRELLPLAFTEKNLKSLNKPT